MWESAGPEITPATELLQESASAVRPGILIGYARCSTERQDLTAQREILRGLTWRRIGFISIMA
jgi:hypothetical protein